MPKSQFRRFLHAKMGHIDVEWHLQCISYWLVSGLVGPKSENVEKVLVFKAFLKGQGSHEDARESLQPSEPKGWEGVGGG